MHTSFDDGYTPIIRIKCLLAKAPPRLRSNRAGIRTVYIYICIHAQIHAPESLQVRRRHKWHAMSDENVFDNNTMHINTVPWYIAWGLCVTTYTLSASPSDVPGATCYIQTVCGAYNQCRAAAKSGTTKKKSTTEKTIWCYYNTKYHRNGTLGRKANN